MAVTITLLVLQRNAGLITTDLSYLKGQGIISWHSTLPTAFVMCWSNRQRLREGYVDDNGGGERNA